MRILLEEVDAYNFAETILKQLDQNGNLIMTLGSLLAIIVTFISLINKVIKCIKKIIVLVQKRRDLENWYNELGYNFNESTQKSFKYYISTRGQDIDPSNSEEIIDSRTYISQELIPYFIQKDFDGNKSKYYIILADSGMGKTTFLYNLHFSYYKKKLKKYEIKFVPLGKKDVCLEIRKIEKKSNVILLLDGLDENEEAISNYESFLQKIVGETIQFHTVIITCRTQFFPSQPDEPNQVASFSINTNEKLIRFEKIYISPFNEEEINLYLRKKYNIIFEKDKIEKSKKIIANCPQLMVRPMLLAYIDDLIVDNTILYNSAYEIYRALVHKWVNREAVDNDVLYEFSEKVAEYMYNKKTIYINEEEIKRICKNFEIHLEYIEAKTRSLLNRDAGGNYKFAHKSILEYFLAKKAFNDLAFRKKVTLDRFNGYDMVKFFLFELSKVDFQGVLQNNNTVLESYTFKYLQLPYNNFEKRRIINCDFEGSNLDEGNFCEVVFKTVRLNNVSLQGANLSLVDLVGADLQNANLRKANLQNADLREANLREADLRGADLIETHLCDANLKWADFRGADLRFADLRGADLRFAIINESQVGDMKKKCNMQNIKVYVKTLDKIINYEDYCATI